MRQPRIGLPENYHITPSSARAGYRRQVRSYELITPLFGGGVDASSPDAEIPINGKTIRGQLRFWWRVMRGGIFSGDLVEMKAAEDMLWGAASSNKESERDSEVLRERWNPIKGKWDFLPNASQGGSLVNINVVITSRGTPRSPFSVVAGRPDRQGRQKPKPESNAQVAPAYVAFPLQPTEQEMKRGGVGMATKQVLVGVRFDLEISFPVYPHPQNPNAYRNFDVEAALWAWETFGGVGARTRRGFGAVKIIEINKKAAPAQLPSSPDELPQFINRKLDPYRFYGLRDNAAWPAGVPCLQRWPVPAIRGTPHEVWSKLIAHYRNFRQMKSANNDYGRSLWPEPDSIRIETGAGAHSILNDCRKFPRAAFGLPIIFHFKDDEVHETTLQGVNHDRLASPLILKPVACAEGTAALVAVFFPQLPPAGDAEDVPANVKSPVRLVGAPSDLVVDASLTSAEAGHQRLTPILNGNTDVIDAFVKSLPSA